MKNRIRPPMGNSLIPDSCALIPCVAHASLTLTSATDRPVDNSQRRPSPTMHALDLSGVVL